MTDDPQNPNHPNPKSGIDRLFDIAEGALGGLEATLGPPTSDLGTAGPSGTVGDSRMYLDVASTHSRAWENYWWAVAHRGKHGEGWHLFPEASTEAICGARFQSHEVEGRTKLEHGKRIVACTSCIIGVSTRG